MEQKNCSCNLCQIPQHVIVGILVVFNSILLVGSVIGLSCSLFMVADAGLNGFLEGFFATLSIFGMILGGAFLRKLSNYPQKSTTPDETSQRTAGAKQSGKVSLFGVVLGVVLVAWMIALSANIFLHTRLAFDHFHDTQEEKELAAVHPLGNAEAEEPPAIVEENNTEQQQSFVYIFLPDGALFSRTTITGELLTQGSQEFFEWSDKEGLVTTFYFTKGGQIVVWASKELPQDELPLLQQRLALPAEKPAKGGE